MTEVVGRLLFGPNVDNCDGESDGFVSGETKGPASLRARLLLLPPLLLALLMLTDDVATGIGSDRRFAHLAFLTALRRHPPSLRVFRALSEISLLLLCAAGSLRVWEANDMTEVVGRLLFGPNVDNCDDGGGETKEYEMTATGEEDTNDNDNGRKLRYSGDGSSFVEASDDNDDDDDNADADAVGDTDTDGQVIVEEGRNSKGREEDDELEEDDEDDYTFQPPALSSVDHRPKPPSSSYVAGVALDLLSSTLISLFLFTLSSAEGGTYIDGLNDPNADTTNFFSKSWSKMAMATARLAAPVFPLLLFLYSSLRCALPWGRRKTFWAVVSRTPWAPYKDVTFRDGFIGDILTSTVRPLQDLAFTTFYILSGLQGWWTASYSIDEAAGPVERSWVVHTVILPACIVSPLWWRFLQNLRQSYDSRCRWPYLGNALKYFLAAEVALFGLFEPDAKQNVLWIGCFVGATLYQVWWDVFQDWALLERTEDDGRSSLLGYYRLRSTRLYSRKSIYYGIFAANFLLRFCWTMTLIPRRYLSQSGMLRDAYSSDFQTFVGPALASAEIIRRSLWGLIRVEWEAIKTSREYAASTASGRGKDRGESGDDSGFALDDGEKLEPMQIGSEYGRGRRRGGGPLLPGLDPILEPYFGMARREMASMTELQILGELCLYATAFTSLGIFAAAHRHVL